MSDKRDLKVLLKSLAPELDNEDYTFAIGTESEIAVVSRPVGTFREEEGVSIICRREEAEMHGLRHSGSFRMITLTIHSSLDAVGLTACVSSALAKEGIPCNVVAGFFHDHLFIPVECADDAMTILKKLR